MNMPHNDVLVFGTETKFAIDVSAAPTSGGIPSVTIGYKRQEAVWMPLIVNAQHSKPVSGPVTWNPDGLKYSSTVVGPDNSRRTDAYSVFASLGAKLSGSGTAQEAGATAGLAQFFATGNAAINVSSNEALVTALKLDDPESSQAQAVAVAAAATTDPEIVALVTERASVRASELTALRRCVRDAAGAWRLPQVVDGASGITPSDRAVLAALPDEAALQDELRYDYPLRTAVLTAARAKFPGCDAQGG